MAIIELAGPAGCGKTTIKKALSEYDRRIQIGVFPNIRNIKNIPFFLWNGSLTLPTFLNLYYDTNDGLFTLMRRKLKIHHSLPVMEMGSLAILNGWHRQLKIASLKNGSIIILDQGPVYMLAELLRYSPPDFHNTASKWWGRVCNDWANLLDMVICLDTSDTVLIERICSRAKHHQIKENSDKWATQFLAQSREAQSDVLNSMAKKRGKVKVLQVDTSHASVNETVKRIFTLLDEEMDIK